eukprot:4718705-Pyramimonas_sp.AAC.1
MGERRVRGTGGGPRVRRKRTARRHSIAALSQSMEIRWRRDGVATGRRLVISCSPSACPSASLARASRGAAEDRELAPRPIPLSLLPPPSPLLAP